MFNIIKEKLSNVDMKSAGIGAVAVIAAEALGFGIYKGSRYLCNAGKSYLEARAAAKQQQEQKGEEK